MLVDVAVFKQSGKFYTDVRHEFEAGDYWAMVEETRGLIEAKKIPGMVEGAEGYHVLVTPVWPDGNMGVPHLFIAKPLSCEAPASSEQVERLQETLDKTFEKGPQPVIEVFKSPMATDSGVVCPTCRGAVWLDKIIEFRCPGCIEEKDESRGVGARLHTLCARCARVHGG